MADNCKDFVNRPLGLYVAAAVIVSLGELGCCIYVIMQDKLKSCTLPEGLAQQVGIEHWIKVQASFAWLNMMFAPYIQYQLMQKLQETPGSSDSEGLVSVDQSRIKDSFVEVFLYDIGVCLYVFAVIASFVWSCFGVIWLSEASPTCDTQGYVSMSAYLGIFFFWGLVCYSVVWYCYISCVSMTPVRWAMAYLPVEQPASAFSAGKGPSAPPAEAEEPRLRRSGCQRACTVSQLTKLAACIGLDFFGSSSYFLPGVGEAADIVYAPVQGIALKFLFSSTAMAILGFTEEILPFTDIMPTATICWIIETFFADSCLGRSLGFRPDY
eukprot:TRINITY_DN74287_c0_g1_i1.p1 TRINITY_DN74287_c0_g1~~TRINITY_DN74287_c0_g1_i1.p1  ORF type:complete len:374 (-),score=55.59 TRINITY_DN74287_c0_g1_i1:186-1160(-)